VVAGEQGQVGAGGSEQHVQQGEGAVGGGGEGAQVAGGFAPDQPHGHGEDPRASSSPAAVAPERMAVSWVWWSLVSTVMPASAAT
jgi:hypothetical protein